MIGVTIVSSELQDNRELKRRIESLGLKVTEGSERDSGIVVLVATGGTERKIERIIKNAEVPLMLWALPDNNSLAAAMEVYSVYKYRAKLFYSPINDAALEEIKKFESVCDALKEIKKKRIGLIGGISDWILTSRI
jgi:L-fucose isomerase-like protein